MEIEAMVPSRSSIIYTIAVFLCASMLRFGIKLYKVRARMLQLRARGLVCATTSMCFLPKE